MENFENVQDDVIYTDVIHNPAPQWLRLELPHCVPSFWLDPITDFISVVVAILEPDAPETALLQVRPIDQNLQFEVALDPRLDRDFDLLALQRAAKAFAGLSGQIASARRMPVPKDPSTNSGDDDQDLQAAGWTEAPMKSQCRNIGSEMNELPLTTSKTKEVPIFQWKSSLKNGGRDIGRDADSARRMLATIQELKRTGRTRPLCPPPPDWKARVDDLVDRFPNFASVVKMMVLTHLVMMNKNETHRYAPLLLVGQPGIGKTYFANALAQTLGLSNAMFISLAGETNGSALGGSSIFWANSSPGKLFETLAWGDNQTTPPANPVVILDEIDKISVGHYNPLGALYSLLEEDTAQFFKDQSLPDITIDARHVRFVCTANDMSLIPEPLLTRMVVFHIDPPSTEQLRGIIRNIYQGLISRLQTPMSHSLSEDVVQAALMLNPRESKVRMECAIACAISEDREYVMLSDWPNVPAAGNQVKRRSIGFTA